MKTIFGEKKKYVKRFFKIDTKNNMLMYSETDKIIDKNPSYSVQFRNLIGVKKNIVTMPLDFDENAPASKDYRTNTKEVSTINPKGEEVDRGPEGFSYAFEIELTDRLFTLYSDSEDKVDLFVHYIE